ncbi:MAG: alpha/beta fold hydrolase [Nakamurella sp.]
MTIAPINYCEPANIEERLVAVGDTTLAVSIRGAGPAVLLIHGGGEDAELLEGLAASLAAAGYRAIAYDRRGTGRSGRANWPGSGAQQHADDAAELLTALQIKKATVFGLSSGAVIALKLAVRNPRLVRRVVAWEPPAVGVLPDGAAMNAAIMAPINDYLAEHPGDYHGAHAILLSTIMGFPVAVDDPAFGSVWANSEPIIRDEPAIVATEFTVAELRDVPLVIVLGSEPQDLIVQAAKQLSQWTGATTVTVTGDHLVHLLDPGKLTDVLTTLDRSWSAPGGWWHRMQHLTFRHHMVTDRGVQEVFDYVSDFNSAHKWRTEVVESTAFPAGPMAVGTRLREIAVVAGRRVVTDSVVDAFEPGSRFTFAHLSGPLPVSGEYRCTPVAAGTRVDYTLHLDLQGWWVIAAPLFRLTGPRTIRQSFTALRDRLAR